MRLGVGLIATISALVLGLLIAAAKGGFDTQSGQVNEITADIILLDNLLAQYGPEAQPIRQQMRVAIGPFADRLWSEGSASSGSPFTASAAAEKIYLEVQGLAPQNDLQRSLQARASQISDDLTSIRLLLFAESTTTIPSPFLVILVFWLVIIFASFSLFSSLNATVSISLALFALSAAGAIYLFLELSSPFSGVMMISSAPLRNALGSL